MRQIGEGGRRAGAERIVSVVAQKRVVHTGDIPWEDEERGTFFAHRRRRLAAAAGGRRLGCSLVELPPGKTAWPFHYHCGNEEAIYVLSGEATLRLGAERVVVRAGDYVALPAGAEHAHQMTNTAADPVRYLVMSTMRDPDVIVYPDSDKVGAIAGAAPGAKGPRDVAAWFPRGAAVDAWAGEPTGAGGTDEVARDRDDAPDREQQIQKQIDEELAQMKRRLQESGES